METLERIWFSFWDRITAVKWLGALVGLLLLAAVIAGGVGIYWSQAPSHFSVSEGPKSSQGEPVVGVATTQALIGLGEALLDKPGGYLSNDKLPPGVWLDNMPSWEFGVLVQARDSVRALRKDFSRSQSQSTEDPDLVEAEPRLHFDHDSWLFPSTEGEYRQALKHLRSYQQRLTDTAQPSAQFYARADNLNDWLGDVSTRLGSLSQRLSASVGQKRVNTDLAGDAAAQQSTATSSELEVKTSWLEIDNVFYEARGTAWALIQLLEAVEQDFGPALDKKNARVSLRQIIRELEATQHTIWSPVILNGSEFGLWANHSLVMASYIARANAAIIDLQKLLSQG